MCTEEDVCTEAMEQMNEMVRQLMQNQQEMQVQLAALRADNEALRTERTQTWGQLPGVLEALRAQADASRSSHERVQLVDTRGIGRPKTFTGDEDAFRSWAAKMESFVTAVFGEDFRRVLEWAVEKPDQVMHGEWSLVFGDESEDIEGRVEGIDNKVQQLHMALAQLTEGEAFDITQNSGVERPRSMEEIAPSVRPDDGWQEAELAPGHHLARQVSS